MAARTIDAGETPDAGARRSIAQDLDTTFVVEAAAGTGKTRSLVTRMVALVREGRATADRITAVTFTVKAARQLGQRFQLALEEAIAAERDAARRERLERALDAHSAGFLGTIHAFCARLLRERPVESGVVPDFAEMEESEDLAQRRAAWERYVQRLFVEGSPHLARLNDAGVLLENLRETFDLLCQNSDVAPASAPESTAPELAQTVAVVRPLVSRGMELLPKAAPDGGWDPLGRALRESARLFRVLDLDRAADCARVLEAFARIRAPQAKAWRERQREAAELFETADAMRASEVEPALRAWREHVHPIVIAAVTPAVEEYAAWRRRSGRLNFQDLLQLARDLLRDRPDVRRALRERFTPLLVDEFQDTDPIQAEVILYLTATDAAEKDWRRLSPVPGSLFVVGDPKQSIYRFRRADIATYARVRDIVERSGGRRLTLRASFRAEPELCDWLNGVFSRRFPAEATEVQAADVPLVAAKKPTGSPPRVWRIDVEGGSRPAETARRDAERVAAAIAAMLAERPRPYEPADFLLLARYRKHLPIYARALERRGIPYEISGGAAFRASEEIATLLPFLRAVADPEDPVALVAALRGPLFGIDDRAFYRFRRSGGRFSFRAGLPAETDPRIARAMELFREARRLADELPPGAAISRIAGMLGWTAVSGAGELGGTRAGNLLKAATMARVFSGDGADFVDIVERLGELTETTDDDTEEMSVEPGRRDAVQLMTLHRAKGLQARVVFLVDPTGERDPNPISAIDRSEEPPRGYFLVRARVGKGFVEIARPPDWETWEKREREFEAAEQDRLLYVGATRAAETLVVSFRRSSRKAEACGPWATLSPYIQQELSAPAPVPSLDSPASATDVAAELERFREDLTRSRAAAMRPSYATASVTALAHAGPLPFRAFTGRGLSWGSVLHRLLEAAMRDPELDLAVFAANVLAEEERPPTEIDEALELVAAVRRSPIWKRALAAKQCLVEVPFALTVPSAELGARDGPDETVLQGAIDLVFEEEGGWALVDYKSDTVDGNLDELVRFYAPQIARYRGVWEKLTGRRTRAGLYFISTGEEVWIQE